ncbi:MAG: sigma-E factor negative regulatory protein [Burkholderiaceae bacterium]
MDMNEQLNKLEALSALADGQLRGEAFARTVESACEDPEARAAWGAWHVAGDALRFGAQPVRSTDGEFVARWRERLAQENAMGMPALDSIAASARTAAAAAPRKEAANDGSFRWKAVAGFASMAAVAAIGWNIVATGPGVSSQPQIALVPAPAQSLQAPEVAVATAAGDRQVMIRDARLDELMAAHRQAGGTSALQMPAGFLRNATFEGGGR